MIPYSTGMSQCRQHARASPARAQPAGRAQGQLADGVPTPAPHRGPGRGHRDQQTGPGRVAQPGRRGPREGVAERAGQGVRAVFLVRGEHRAHRLPVRGDRVHRRQALGRGDRPRGRGLRGEGPVALGAQQRARLGAARAVHGQHQVGPCREHPTPFHLPKLARPAPKRTRRGRDHPIRSWRAVANDRTRPGPTGPARCRPVRHAARRDGAPPTGAGRRRPGRGAASRDRPGTARCAPWSSCCPGTTGRCSPRRSPPAGAGPRRPGPRCAACR